MVSPLSDARPPTVRACAEGLPFGIPSKTSYGEGLAALLALAPARRGGASLRRCGRRRGGSRLGLDRRVVLCDARLALLAQLLLAGPRLRLPARPRGGQAARPLPGDQRRQRGEPEGLDDRRARRERDDEQDADDDAQDPHEPREEPD